MLTNGGSKVMMHVIRFAYLDAGTGSMVIQSLIGIVAGIALFGRKAIASLRMRKDKKKPTELKKS